jgi:hypothetical protein
VASAKELHVESGGQLDDVIAQESTHAHERVAIRAHLMHAAKEGRALRSHRSGQPQDSREAPRDLIRQHWIAVHVRGVEIVPATGELACDAALKALLVPRECAPRASFLNLVQ